MKDYIFFCLINFIYKCLYNQTKKAKTKSKTIYQVKNLILLAS